MRAYFKHLLVVACMALGAWAPASAQTPPTDLASPPADARIYSTFSSAGEHGRTHVWRGADGVRWSRFSLLLRGFFTEIDQQLRTDDAGRVTSLVVRGATTSGPVDETFSIVNGQARWTSPVDQGEAAAGGLYWSYGGTIDSTTAFFQALMRDSDGQANLLPSGAARIERLTELDVSANGETKHVVAYAVSGVYWFPLVLWFDTDGEFFASVGGMSTTLLGWQSVEPQLAQAQTAALAARAPALVAQLGQRSSVPVAFRDVRLYDADAGIFRDNMTVVATDGRITAVGPAATTPIPGLANVIDGAGRTLVPGLWDVHMHFGDDTTGPLLLSIGVTNVRDPGNRGEDLLPRMRRINAGEMLGPAIYPSLMIDGPGERAAQFALVARNRSEGVALVRQAAEQGYIGVKLYGSLDPALVRPIAQEARRHGLRVQGHIPTGMRPLAAVRAGYTEITHINWVMMQGVPDEIIADSNGLNRFYGPARYAADYNFESGPMASFFDELARRRIIIDPTIATFEGLYVPEQGEITPAYAAWANALPAAIGRELRGGGIAATDEVSRARMRESFNNMLAGIAALHRRGVPIIAGTDGFGLEIIRELELYVQAGLTPAEALNTATINAARSAGVADRTGSIAIGKDADLALVVGDPSQNIGDLRHVEYVMRDGRLMQAAALRAALGIGAPN